MVDEDGTTDVTGPKRQAERHRRRPLLGFACVLPLLLAAGFLAGADDPRARTAEVTRAEAVAQPGAMELFCPGPLQPPSAALEGGPDAELAVTAPSTSIDLAGLALDPASSVLFGTVSGSQTLQDEDGSVQAASLTALAADGTALPARSVAADLGFGVLAQRDVAGAARVQAVASDGGRPVTSAVQSTLTPSGDFRSLSVTRCAEPSTSAAFLGLSTVPGASSALVLHNPTSRPATASVQVWTPEGPAAMAGRSQVVVPAGEEETVLLESVAPGHDEVGAQIDVLGAPLAMHLEVSRRNGLAPAGAEILTPLAPGATSLTMPGVEFSGAGTTVVLANPEGGETTARVRVLGGDGDIAAAEVPAVTVPAGAVVPVPLQGVPAGLHTVQVEAESPIQAVTRAQLAGADLPGDTVGAPVDMTLVEPVPAITTNAVTALPASGASGYLDVAATAAAEVSVIPLAADGTAGTPIVLDVPAQSRIALPDTQLRVGGEPAAGLAVVPDVPGAVHATWLQRVGDGADGVLLSALPLRSSGPATESVTVRLSR